MTTAVYRLQIDDLDIQYFYLVNTAKHKVFFYWLFASSNETHGNICEIRNPKNISDINFEEKLIYFMRLDQAKELVHNSESKPPNIANVIENFVQV